MFLKSLIIICVVAFLHPTISETPVQAQMAANTDIYKDKTLRTPVGSAHKGDVVEVLEDYSGAVYRISLESVTGWVSSKSLIIEAEKPTDKTILSTPYLEDFVNTGGYTSQTKHMVLVDINRHNTHVFEGQAGDWSLLRSFDCSTGLNISPTTRGTFTLSERGEWFYSHRLASGAKYWIRFNGHFLFHSTPMDEGGNFLPGENIVGTKKSNGCVRLLLDDAKWLYENVTDSTTVVIV